MYILSSGKIASTNKQRLADIINTNMTIDVCDVPLSGYGIIQNFSKESLQDTLIIIELMVTDFLDELDESGLKFVKVEYTNNQFIVTFDYNGSELLVNLDSLKLYE